VLHGMRTGNLEQRDPPDHHQTEESDPRKINSLYKTTRNLWTRYFHDLITIVINL
jgi:hypothetical protein